MCSLNYLVISLLAVQAIPSIATFHCNVVCCHTHAHCLNGLTDLVATRRVNQVCRLQWRIALVRKRGGDFRGWIPQRKKHAIANCCCHLMSRNEKLPGLLTVIPPSSKLFCDYSVFVATIGMKRNLVFIGRRRTTPVNENIFTIFTNIFIFVL